MSTLSVRVTVGRGLNPVDLLSALQQHTDELEEVLVGDVSHHNVRATYSYDSLELDEIERESGRGCYTLRYRYGWEAYWGCKDMNDGNIENDEISFRYCGGEAIFSGEVFEKRDTHDEF